MSSALAALSFALRSIARARLRTAVTSLGIVVGIAAVVVASALVFGARAKLDAQLQSLGSNVIYVFPRSAGRSGARLATGVPLTERDADAIAREVPAVRAVATFSSARAQVSSEFDNAKIDVSGVGGDYLEVRGYAVQQGRWFTEAEVRARAKVCVLGSTATDKLFHGVPPVGRWLRIGRHPCRVVGLLGSKGSSGFDDQDDRVLMPIGSYRARVVPSAGDRVQLVMASAESAAAVPRAERAIDALLRQRRRTRPDDEPDFRVRSQEQFRAAQSAVFDALTLLMVGVAGIALVVGGVGVMNVLLVGVSERTREVGVRMALGARAVDVERQVLFESVILTLLGGLAGVALAGVIVLTLRAALGWPLVMSPWAILVALASSGAVGLVFGYLPARRAARLDPIEALRHE